jgi:hypothetical protein
MFQQDSYLNDNLVCGMITKTENLKENSEKISTENLKQEQLFEEISQMHEQMLFERNVAIFYFNTLRKIWRS